MYMPRKLFFYNCLHFDDPSDHPRRSIARFCIVLIASASLCCLIIQMLKEEGSSKESALTEINAELTPASNPFCSVFSDSDDCDQQAEGEASKYWTSSDIRDKLWSTMKALAEVKFAFTTVFFQILLDNAGSWSSAKTSTTPTSPRAASKYKCYPPCFGWTHPPKNAAIAPSSSRCSARPWRTR